MTKARTDAEMLDEAIQQGFMKAWDDPLYVLAKEVQRLRARTPEFRRKQREELPQAQKDAQCEQVCSCDIQFPGTWCKYARAQFAKRVYRCQEGCTGVLSYDDMVRHVVVVHEYPSVRAKRVARYFEYVDA